LAISLMNKIYVLGMKKDIDKVVSFLQEKGCIEVVDAYKEFESKEGEGNLSDIYDKISKLEFILKELNVKSKILEEMKPTKKTVNFEKVYEELKNLKNEEKTLGNFISKLKEERKILKNFIDFDFPFSYLKNIENFKIYLIELSKKERAKFVLEVSKIPVKFYREAKKEKNKIYYWLITEKNYPVGDLGFRIVDVPQIEESPRERVNKIDEIILEKYRQIEAINKERKKYSLNTDQFAYYHIYYKNRYEREKVKEILSLKTESVFVISGWIEEEKVLSLKEGLNKRFQNLLIFARKPEKSEDVPVVLKNKKFVKPFEAVTEMYGAPKYRTVDPTPPISFFFPLFFGICLTDAVYGLIISVAIIFMFKFLNPKGGFRKFLYLFLISGIATVIAGALTGGWFGDLFSRLPNPFLNNFREKMMLLDPVKKATVFMGISILIGFIQVFIGVLIGFLKNLYFKDYLQAFLKDLPSLMVQTSIFLLVGGRVIGAFSVPEFLSNGLIFVLCISIVLIIIYAFISQKEILFKLFWAYFGVYGVLTGNSLADILSYVRLFALGLTTGLLALSINEIVFLIGKSSPFAIPVAVLIFIIGHTVNLLLNALGAYVHTSRLQYYEFFTKFVETGGRFFKPFRIIKAVE